MGREQRRYISHGQYTDPPVKKRDYKANPASSIFKQAFDWEMLDFLTNKAKDEVFNVRMHYNDFRSAHCGHHLKRAGTTKSDLDRHVLELYYTVTDMMDELQIPMPDKLTDIADIAGDRDAS